MPSHSFAQETLHVREFVDGTHRFISDSWDTLNYQVDSFFSEQEREDDDFRSEITVSFTGLLIDGKEDEFFADFRLRVDLPRVSKKLSATLERETNRIVEVQGTEAERVKASQESSFGANFSWANITSLFGHIDLSLGIRTELPLNPYARANYLKQFAYKDWRFIFEQFVSFHRQESLREYTRVDFAYIFSPTYRLNQSNVLAWERHDSEFKLRNSLSLDQKLSDRTFLAYTLGANALLSPTYHYRRYDISTSIRRKMYKDWVYASLSVGSEFEKERDWESALFLLTRLELVF